MITLINENYVHKFDVRKEAYASYKYQVMNLKSQCAPTDYKYLAPKLISNFIIHTKEHFEGGALKKLCR